MAIPGMMVGRRVGVERGECFGVKDDVPHGARRDTPQQGPGLAPAENERKGWEKPLNLHIPDISCIFTWMGTAWHSCTSLVLQTVSTSVLVMVSQWVVGRVPQTVLGTSLGVGCVVCNLLYVVCTVCNG